MRLQACLRVRGATTYRLPLTSLTVYHSAQATLATYHLPLNQVHTRRSGDRRYPRRPEAGLDETGLLRRLYG